MNNKDYSLELKYRPQTFDEVIGNKGTIETLKIMLSRTTGRKHTLMLCGPSGTGKTTLARIIANELKAGEFDIDEINVSNMRGIETARDLIGGCGLSPLAGPVRVYILNEVHGATKEWQRAMLEILEEPPKHVYFILVTTEPERLIPTILQRAMIYPVTPSEQHEIVSLLWRILKKEKVQDFSEKLVDEIATAASGSPRRALTLLAQVVDIPDEGMALRVIEDNTYGRAEAPEALKTNSKKSNKTASEREIGDPRDCLTPTKEGKIPEFRPILPLPLTSLPHWVVWQRQMRDGRPTKVPIDPKTGKNAVSNEPGTWASYDAAVSYYESHRDDLGGIGFQFGNSGFVGIDLHRCRTPESGEVESWALQVIKEVDSYTEISPGGTDLHIIICGELPSGGSRNGRVAMYDSGFFAMTGNRLRGGTPAQPRERQLHAVWERYLCNE